MHGLLRICAGAVLGVVAHDLGLEALGGTDDRLDRLGILAVLRWIGINEMGHKSPIITTAKITAENHDRTCIGFFIDRCGRVTHDQGARP